MKVAISLAAFTCVVLQAVSAAPLVVDDADLAIRCGADVPPESELGKRCSVWSYLDSVDIEERAHVSSYIPSSADLETRCGADVPPESELGKRCSVWSYLASADLEERAHVSSYIPSSDDAL